MNQVLIKGSHVVTMDDDMGAIPNCDVLIRDGRITDVTPGIDGVDAEIIDGTGTITLPGFVDTHRHLWQTLIRGALPSCTLMEYFGTVVVGLAPTFLPEDVYAGNLIGAYEALNAGITTVVDWCNCANTPEHVDAAIAGLREASIRSMYAYGTPGGPEWLMGSELRHPEDARRARDEHFASSDQLLTFALALRGPAVVSRELNLAEFELARELDARITVHAAMRVPGMPSTEIQSLHADRLLGPDVTFVHGNEMTSADLEQVAAAGCTMSISPYAELIMGHGHPPTLQLLEHGIRPTLSMDVACTAPGDMFSQMRTALAHGRSRQLPAGQDEPFAPTLTTTDVLRFATIDGARACGLDHRTGSISVGKAGDLVVLRSDAINTMCSEDPVATAVVCADTSNVDTVLVGGKVVKRDGTLMGVDLPRLRRLADAARERRAIAGPNPGPDMAGAAT